jgi:hypothetical protein
MDAIGPAFISRHEVVHLWDVMRHHTQTVTVTKLGETDAR